MAPLVRALTYASLFIVLVLFLLPAQLLRWAGVSRPSSVDWIDLLGFGVGVAGLGLALWCVVTFAVIGSGTPAPFDPPRRLVVRGPYRFVRNPMYIGAFGALAGTALFFGSWWMGAFAAGFFVVTHLFVVLYEEPTLTRMFGKEYQAYCSVVRRWWPGRGSGGTPVICALVPLLATPNGALAQTAWPDPGTQVRIVAPAVSADTIRGHIWELSDTAMLLQRANSRPVTIEYSNIVQLDTAVYGSYGRPVLIGGLTFGALGTALGVAASGLADSPSGQTTGIITMGLIGAGLGVALGVVAGARTVTGWQPYYAQQAAPIP